MIFDSAALFFRYNPELLIVKPHEITINCGFPLGEGFRGAVRLSENYLSISSISKHSSTSPTLMSVNFSSVMPHS